MRDYGDERRQERERQRPRADRNAWAPAPEHEPRGAYDDPYSPHARARRDAWNPPGPALPLPPREPPRDPRRPVPREGGSSGRGAPSPSQRRSTLLGALLLIVLPLLGAVAGGPGLGIIFAACAVVAALGATLLCTPGGLWWIVPCTPTMLLTVAFAWITVQSLNSAKSTTAAATNLFQGVAAAFPGIAAGTLAAFSVAGVRTARSRTSGGGRRV